jgi:hypothetical protein
MSDEAGRYTSKQIACGVVGLVGNPASQLQPGPHQTALNKEQQQMGWVGEPSPAAACMPPWDRGWVGPPRPLVIQCDEREDSSGSQLVGVDAVLHVAPISVPWSAEDERG